MLLSYEEIENIADAVILDFHTNFPQRDKPGNQQPRKTPIELIATRYLGLKVSYEKLSDDGTILGVTAYTDTAYLIEEEERIRQIPLKQNQVLLDECFIHHKTAEKLVGKGRFTLAHECAHQILFQLEDDGIKQSSRNQYAERKAYPLRDLKSREDWNEWQANALGAALLLPQSEVAYACSRLIPKAPITNYGGRFNTRDSYVIRRLCNLFQVSRATLIIRLRLLGYLIDRPYAEYYDPLEVWA